MYSRRECWKAKRSGARNGCHATTKALASVAYCETGVVCSSRYCLRLLLPPPMLLSSSSSPSPLWPLACFLVFELELELMVLSAVRLDGLRNSAVAGMLFARPCLKRTSTRVVTWCS